MITSLGGGVGAGKFLKGLSLEAEGADSERLSVIVNSADDINLSGLHISPDIDTITYWLSGIVDKKKGWGIDGDTFNFIDAAGALGNENWFRIGDRDLATHITRTEMIKSGLTLSDATREIARRLGAADRADIIPMTDCEVRTWVRTDLGEMHFQEYYVRRKMEPQVSGVSFRGIEAATPAPGVLEAINGADKIVLCPSNPVISIGPILEVAGVRNALRESKAVIAAVSPLVGGRPLKGPADRLMKSLGLEVSSFQIARMYSDFLNLMVIDNSDSHEAEKIKSAGLETLVTDTVISNTQTARALARAVLEKMDSLR
ncbi:2-phospho-L-lactate transferase [Candidatus Mycalebacterium sp.]